MGRTWLSVSIGHGIRIGRSIADSDLWPHLPSWRRYEGLEPPRSRAVCSAQFIAAKTGDLSGTKDNNTHARQAERPCASGPSLDRVSRARCRQRNKEGRGCIWKTAATAGTCREEGRRGRGKFYPQFKVAQYPSLGTAPSRRRHGSLPCRTNCPDARAFGVINTPGGNPRRLPQLALTGGNCLFLMALSTGKSLVHNVIAETTSVALKAFMFVISICCAFKC
jgi:hypothetical protein